MKLVRIKRTRGSVDNSKKIEIVELYCEDRLTIRKISAVTGVASGLVNRVLQEAGVKREGQQWGTNGVDPESAAILARANAIRREIVVRRRREKIAQRIRLTANLPAFGDRFELYNCSLQNAPIEPETVDAIITDPPYIYEKIHVYRTLGRMAGKWLKPGGGLFVMSGHVWLPEVMQLILEAGGGLEYYWIMCWSMGAGGKNLAKGRNLTISWKPVLWFQKGRNERKLIGDVISADSLDHLDGSAVHHWGQSLTGFENLVRKVTTTGDLVCDPFVGGGTTAIAALKNNRRFIGVDISKESVEITKNRIWELNGNRLCDESLS